jgi:hypothetical protein
MIRRLLLVACLLSPTLAHAEGAGADALIERGIQLRQQGHDDQALAEFQRAYALTPTPRALAQMGLAEQALGQWVPAEQHVREALGARGDSWVDSHRSVLDGALATIAKHIGLLEIRGGMAGAEVRLDGVRIGALPIADARRVEVGTRTLEVRAPGYYPVSRTVIVTAGATSRETVDLVPESQPPPGAVVGPAPPRGDGPMPDGKRPPAETATESSGSTQRTVGWVALGIAGAFAATGVVALVARSQQVSDYNSDPTCPGMASAMQPPSCADRQSSASTWGTVALVGFVGAGVLAVTSVTLIATAPRRAAVGAVACRAGLGSLACGVVF